MNANHENADNEYGGPTVRVEDIPLDSIVVGDRRRGDLGDVESLATSIQQSGLLHPIILTSTNHLVSGLRRIEAFRLLERPTIPAHIADSLDDTLRRLQAERDENTCRKALTPSEYVNMGEAILTAEKAAAKARMAVRSEKFSEVKDTDKGKATEKVAEVFGVSAPTYEHARSVVRAAQEDPERFAPLVDLMDETNVGRAYGQLRTMKSTDPKDSNVAARAHTPKQPQAPTPRRTKEPEYAPGSNAQGRGAYRNIQLTLTLPLTVQSLTSYYTPAEIATLVQLLTQHLSGPH